VERSLSATPLAKNCGKDRYLQQFFTNIILAVWQKKAYPQADGPGDVPVQPSGVFGSTGGLVPTPVFERAG
ncbi:MAG TPA: hypothetical protein PKL59_20840, partial [Nitrospira sp.]|nr:hypothetical protein [Nitrospira sp.]HNM20415.1 hypothetical protein [Nitrospira sp.]